MDLSKLTGPQLKVLPLLASGKSNKECAEEAGVSESSVSKMKNIPHFRAALNWLRREALERTVSQIQMQLPLVAASVINIAINGTEEKSRLEAGKLLFQFAGLLDGKRGADTGPTNAAEIAASQKLAGESETLAAEIAGWAKSA